MVRLPRTRGMHPWLTARRRWWDGRQRGRGKAHGRRHQDPIYPNFVRGGALFLMGPVRALFLMCLAHYPLATS